MKKIIFFTLLFFLNVAYSQAIYVTSKTAKLRLHPHKKKETIIVKRGEKLLKIKKVRKWIRVLYNSKKFWVYKGKVSRKKPRKDLSLVAYPKDEIAAGSPILVEGHINQGSHLRGFDSENKDYAKMFMEYSKSFITTNKDIPTAENNITLITSDMLEKFQEEGQIGPYADPGDVTEFE